MESCSTETMGRERGQAAKWLEPWLKPGKAALRSFSLCIWDTCLTSWAKWRPTWLWFLFWKHKNLHQKTESHDLFNLKLDFKSFHCKFRISYIMKSAFSFWTSISVICNLLCVYIFSLHAHVLTFIKISYYFKLQYWL